MIHCKILDSIITYTGGEGYTVNKKLREGIDVSLKGDENDVYRTIIQHLDMAFDIIPPIQKTITLYRGMPRRYNFNYSTKGFLSTTKNLEEATIGSRTNDDDTECCVLEITIPVRIELVRISKARHFIHGVSDQVFESIKDDVNELYNIVNSDS